VECTELVIGKLNNFCVEEIMMLSSNDCQAVELWDDVSYMCCTELVIDKLDEFNLKMGIIVNVPLCSIESLTVIANPLIITSSVQNNALQIVSYNFFV
jgi:hypothetical protein